MSRPIDLIPNYSPRRHLMLLSGDPGVGKSRFAMQCARLLAEGQPFFWEAQAPIKILVATERTKEVLAVQLHDLSITPHENLTYLTVEDLTATDLSPLQTVAGRCQQLRPDLVILDTVGHFWPLAVGKSVSDYQAMLTACRGLQKFATQYQCAVWMVHHAAKEREGNRYTKTWQKSLGSQAIMGAVTAAWFLSEETIQETTRWLKLEAVSHIDPPLSPLYLRSNPNQPYQVVTKDDLPTSAASDASGKTENAIAEALVYGRSIKKIELVSIIQAALKVTRQMVYRAINRLLEKGVIREYTDDDTGAVMIALAKPQ